MSSDQDDCKGHIDCTASRHRTGCWGNRSSSDVPESSGARESRRGRYAAAMSSASQLDAVLRLVDLEVAQALAERDRARATAVALEQELARVEVSR